MIGPTPVNCQTVARVLTDPRTHDRHLYLAMRPLADCDALWDHPDHKHAARMILWLAWQQKLRVRTAETNEMAWFLPPLPEPRRHQPLVEERRLRRRRALCDHDRGMCGF